MTPADLEAVHTRMRTDVKLAGGWIDAVYACPHAPDARCECRKPAPGLIQQAIVNSGVRAEETLVVGDDGRDLDAARAAGVDAALVMTGKGLRTAASLPAGAPPVYDDLRTLALHLLVEGRAKGEPIQ